MERPSDDEELELLLLFSSEGHSRREIRVAKSNVVKEIESLAAQHFGSRVVVFSGLSASAAQPTHILQRWSGSWGEYVDVSSLDQIKSRDKLMLVLKSTVSV